MSGDVYIKPGVRRDSAPKYSKRTPSVFSERLSRTASRGQVFRSVGFGVLCVQSG